MALSDSDIKNLVQKAQKGDKEAFGQIYDMFFEKIYKYIFFRTKETEEAEDLASVVFLKVWKNLSKYKVSKKAKFSTWLFQVARFTLIDHYRKKKIQVSIEDVQEMSDKDFTIHNAELSEAKKYLLLLSEDHQTVISLRYFEGLDFEEIAKVVGRTAVGTRVLLHRALKKLSNLMGVENE